MSRTDLAYWSRLRKDKLSNWTVGLAFLSFFVATQFLINLTISGTHYQSREKPLYWAILLPVVWWTILVMGFHPHGVKLLTPVTYLAPLVTIGCAAYSVTHNGTWVWPSIAVAVSVGTAVASRLCYRRSLLRREGPSR